MYSKYFIWTIYSDLLSIISFLCLKNLLILVVQIFCSIYLQNVVWISPAWIMHHVFQTWTLSFSSEYSVLDPMRGIGVMTTLSSTLSSHSLRHSLRRTDSRCSIVVSSWRARKKHVLVFLGITFINYFTNQNSYAKNCPKADRNYLLIVSL